MVVLRGDDIERDEALVEQMGGAAYTRMAKGARVAHGPRDEFTPVFNTPLRAVALSIGRRTPAQDAPLDAPSPMQRQRQTNFPTR